MKSGKIIQIIGPVIDVDFGESNEMPALLNALQVGEGQSAVIVEVAKHLEPGKIRAVAMSTTDGLRRGDIVTDTGEPIKVPVGSEVLGNIFDVLGRPINEPNKKFKKYYPIHRSAPKLTSQSSQIEIFETGIKVIDLI